MRTRGGFSRLFLIALAAVFFAPAMAYCQEDKPVVSKPGASNESFRMLRSRCETEVPSGKASGDICANAAAILLGEDLSEEHREMSEAHRIKFALRLLERGVDSSNLAAGRAYDLYSKFDLMLTGGYSDPYRANELMDMMIRKSYPGGVLRKARTAVSIFSFDAQEAEKREGCAVARKLTAGGKLDADSAKIAKEVLASSYCTTLAENKN